MKKTGIVLFTLIGGFLLSACGGKPSTSQGSGGNTSSGTSEVVTNGANGAYNYSAASYEERGKILEQLEKYALDNFLGGIPLYDDSAMILYNERLTIPSNTYIPNYGFGVGEGTINSPMEAETVEAFKMYYHTWTTQEPVTLNYLNASDSNASDIIANFQSAYYSTKLTSDKKSYEWYCSLAKEKPIALNANEDGMATKWKVKLHANEEGYVYDIETSDPKLAAYKGRKIQLEDYLTPFKAACDNGWYRAASDLASATSGFVGVADYIAEVNKGEAGNPDWSKVGIQIDESDNSIIFEFNQAKTPFYAMYSLSSFMYAPIPESFFTDIGGVQNYGKTGDVDSVLSTGMYTLSHWETGNNFALRKNPLFYDKELASFEGYHYKILKDSNVAFDEFLAGKLDSATIPSTRIKEFMNDSRMRKTLGSTVWKFQVNSCDQATWEQYFGENGSIYPHKKENYWEIKPIMNNEKFLNGLYYSVNRQEMADTLGKNPTQAFLSDAYMIDPEKGISFRSSEEGKAVLADKLPETYGYSTSLAKQLFKAAVDEEVSAGRLTRGTEANPTEIKLTVWYQAEIQTTDEGLLMKKYWEQTFNDAVDGVELVLDYKYTSNFMDCYYAMMHGEYDLGFGAISGNTLDPISFMETVCSDNRSSFTLSWGKDTSKATNAIQYDGKAWSFDGLLGAANGGAVLKDGEAATLFDILSQAVTVTEDKKYKVTVTGYAYPSTSDVQVDIVDVTYYNPETQTEVSVKTSDVTIGEDGSWTFETTIDSANAEGYGYLRFYYTTTVLGIQSSVLVKDAYFEFAAKA